MCTVEANKNGVWWRVVVCGGGIHLANKGPCGWVCVWVNENATFTNGT